MKRVVGHNNKLRIIGGKWRGRKLQFPSTNGLRPTGDRIRETLFNWLAPYLAGARCLDLFAGSGALGFEALSRGAKTVTFVDRHEMVCRQLRENCDLLGCKDDALIVEGNALEWLNNAPCFDLVFLDPPFANSELPKVIPMIARNSVVCERSLIYVESSSYEGNFQAPWKPIKEKLSGAVRYTLYQV